ncbi:hypothetical protein RFM26_02715 [Mesorhizobium sp. VK23B]|uniref:Uncharacterized protein n=1 Tax=Mesorhizobium dulcispinae TaxID=3072316 RepID=A0ABU4X881_9HYPH|nr:MULTISPECIES: hypothetical protein [unclassified Mesorhizobium]MDX8464597.1 hypothetical protein [Mesorhizobium sp. VK23B]MDX8470983.1 hypothetical protein [Mesorhizobium sp. VK23A]
MISLGFDPPAVLFGNSGIGFVCDAVTLDDSVAAAAPGTGAPGIDPPKVQIEADLPGWRGLIARQLEFFLPPEIPVLGGHPIGGYFELPRAAAPKLVVETKVVGQAGPGEPPTNEFRVRIECLDPTATGLSGLVPTLITATIDIQGDSTVDVPSGPIHFLAGKPVRYTAALARDPANSPGEFRLTIGVSAQGKNGLLSVDSNNNLPPHIFNVTSALASTLIANGKAEQNSTIAKFVSVGAPLSSLFNPKDSHFVLHGAEVESSGHGLPVGGPVKLRLDYSVAARVTKLGAADFGIEMQENLPMRVRIRGVGLTFDPAGGGLEMFKLDCEHAEMEIENPGAWNIGPLKRLFDVVDSRSGRGSFFIEAELRFKLNLGPVTVSNMTLRAEARDAAAPGATPSFTIRGMQASLTVPGLVSGDGSVHVVQDGFSAGLSTSLIPLKLGLDAGVEKQGEMVVIDLGVDLPAPVPLANSGFGLFGIGGTFGVSAEPNFAGNGGDPLLAQLAWTPRAGASAFKPKPGQMTVGFEAVVGTLPDFGFSLSAKAGLVVSTPELSVRGALNGRVMQPPVKISDPSTPDASGISFLGFIHADRDGLTFALVGSAKFAPLLRVRMPVAGRYRFGAHADDWYNYLGTDGSPALGQDRSLGPITAEVLPDLLGIRADAYLMMRGKGMLAWPHGRPRPGGLLNIPDGFVVAFGFALQSSFGPRPIAYADLYASLDLLVGAKPPTLSGFGRAGGGLHLGPFSLGVEAQVSFHSQGDIAFLWCQVTGRIELLFFDVEGTVMVTFGDSEREPDLPLPERHPLDQVDSGNIPAGSTPTLTDDSYRIVARMVENPAEIKPEMHVWPDTIISIPFATMPTVEASAGDQFPGVRDGKPAPVRLGSEMLHYDWTLHGLTLAEVDEDDPFEAGTPADGQLAARWQVGRVGSEVAELILLTTGGDLWVNRITEPETFPRDPLFESADECNRPARPEPGWAIGVAANPADPGFRLPPDPISFNRLISRVDVRMTHYGRLAEIEMSEFWLPLDGLGALPSPYEVAPAVIVDWDFEFDLGERRFAGAIAAPALFQIAGATVEPLQEFRSQSVVLATTEEVVEGLLILLLDDKEGRGIVVAHDDVLAWDPEPTLEEIDGGFVHRFRQPAETQTMSIRVQYPVNARVAVIGLGAMTKTAVETAQQQKEAKERLRETLKNAADATPLLFAAMPFEPHKRAILKPGTLYRLDVDMSWQGTLSKQDKAGNIVLSKHEPDGRKYRRGGDPEASTLRRLFFRTAKLERELVPVWTSGFGKLLTRRQDVFNPDMIARYLAGYEPAQGERFRFRRDRLRAHFKKGHTSALLDAYGFTLGLALRCTSRPGEEHANPTPLELAWGAISDAAWLDPIDKRRLAIALEADCPAPLPGATASAQVDLLPDAWYEVYVEANSSGGGKGRLPGVSFHTSRWTDPHDMFAGLGFDVTTGAHPQARPVLIGDLEVPTVAVAAGGSGDIAFTGALAKLGLEGWPVAEAPRLSWLWTRATPNGDWLFAGLMVESPEPLERPERLQLRPARLDMGFNTNVTFATWSDSGSFRVLFVPNAPFPVVDHEVFAFPEGPVSHAVTPKVTMQAASIEGGGQSLVSGSIVLPLKPGFAEDPK